MGFFGFYSFGGFEGGGGLDILCLSEGFGAGDDVVVWVVVRVLLGLGFVDGFDPVGFVC